MRLIDADNIKMLEILYRIYEVPSEEQRKKNLETDRQCGFYSSTSKAENTEILMDCMLCDSRNQFKEVIKEMYGVDIAFRYSKKLKEGDLYCIIIGEHAWDKEKYFGKTTYKCDCCGSKVEVALGYDIRFSSHTLSNELASKKEYKKMRFCSDKCRMEKLSLLKTIDEDLKDLVGNEWIDNKMFNVNGVCGYIYKITKKSTGEVYIGQTKYIPIFRWGQHLKTDRFDLINILDYKFETLEVVKAGFDILKIEENYIKEYVNKYGKLCLNVIHNRESEVE